MSRSEGDEVNPFVLTMSQEDAISLFSSQGSTPSQSSSALFEELPPLPPDIEQVMAEVEQELRAIPAMDERGGFNSNFPR